MQAVQAFKIPTDLLEDYYIDHMYEARKMGLVVLEDGHEVVRTDYKLFFVSAVKAFKVC